MIMNVALTGCGNVGRAFLELIRDKKEQLERQYGLELRVTLVVTHRKGVVLDRGGIDLALLLKELEENGSFSSFPQASGSFEELLRLSGARILAEATPTNLTTGEPGLSYMRSALSMGLHVVTVNKGPLAAAWDELQALAREHSAKFRYEGVVMSGTPLVQMAQHGLLGCAIQKVEGILNGTTNFMLSVMEAGLSFDEALAEAQKRGYAEADPSGDLEGWDAAVKVSILARILFGAALPVGDVEREGITHISGEQVRNARKHGRRIKLISGIERRSDGRIRGFVAPREVNLNSPLAGISGASNAVTLSTDNLGEITLSGPGAGQRETAQALLMDLIGVTE